MIRKLLAGLVGCSLLLAPAALAREYPMPEPAPGYSIPTTIPAEETAAPTQTPAPTAAQAEATGAPQPTVREYPMPEPGEGHTLPPEPGEATPEPDGVTPEPKTPEESVYMLVNKENELPADYVPSDLTVPDVAFRDGVLPERRQMRAEAAEALEKLFAAAQADGLELIAVSGYRSYTTQSCIYARRLQEMGEKYVSRYIAKPGQSEHQTGLAMDLGAPGCVDLTERFAETEEYAWLQQHAHEYGFIVRYPREGENETGYAFLPWHIRYLGDRAEEVYRSGYTYETYLRQKENVEKLLNWLSRLNDVVE